MQKLKAVILGLTVLLVTQAPAQEVDTGLKAKCLEVAQPFMEKGGYTLADMTGGQLSQGKFDLYKSDLLEGNYYLHVVAASEPASDIKLAIYDVEERLIAQGKGNGHKQASIIENSVKWSGYYRLVIKMAKGQGKYCYMRFYR